MSSAKFECPSPLGSDVVLICQKTCSLEKVTGGSVSICGNWAKFEGDVGPKDGMRFVGDLEYELSLDFLAILQKVDGKWRTLRTLPSGPSSDPI